MRTFFQMIFLMLLVPVSGYAFSVNATVDKTQMTFEDTLTLTLTINDAKHDVDTSDLKDFKIVSQSSGSSFQWINGETIKEFKYSYTLVPLKKGKLLIPPFAVTGNGKSKYTNSIRIRVTDTLVNKSQKADIFTKARVDVQSPYAGQQIVYTFSLYYAAQIANLSLQRPDFEGFVVKETEGEESHTTIIDGRQYKVIEKQIILIPLKPGKYEIPPSVLNCHKVIRGKRQRRDPLDSFFGDSFFGNSRLQRKIFRTESLVINVKPLPAYDLESSFSGLVGRFSMKSDVESWDMNVGDSTTLTITIQGAGNIMDGEEPVVKVPESFKMYRDNPEEKIKLGKKGFSGSKIFRYALVAVESGGHTIPPVKFSYFDVEKGQYKLVTTGPFKINVAPTISKSNETTVPAIKDQGKQRFVKKKIEYTGRDILPLKESLKGIENSSVLSFYTYMILLLIPGLIAGMTKIALIYTGRDTSVSSIMKKRAEAALKFAGKAELSEEEFLSALYKAFISIVFSKGDVSGETLITSEARDILVKAGVNEDVVSDAESVLNMLESIRFSGQLMDNELRKTLLERTQNVIRRIR